MWSVINILLIIPITFGFNLGTFNTAQVFTNELRDGTIGPQIFSIATSGLDAICLQELYDYHRVEIYTGSLYSYGYTNSFGIHNIYEEEGVDTDLPRANAPCSVDQIAALVGCEAREDVDCSHYWGNPLLYAECMAEQCPVGFTTVQYTECVGCVGGIGSFGLDQATTYSICGNVEAYNSVTSQVAPEVFPDGLLMNFTDGAVILSKSDYPITNTWSFTIPSWLILERRLQIAQINICAETDPENPDCTDSIIVGCTHFDSSDHVLDNDVVSSPLDAINEYSSHWELNKIETEFVADIFTNDFVDNLGITDNVYGVFLLGDMNNGQIFDRCTYGAEEGYALSDGCYKNKEDKTKSDNIYDLWAENDLIDSPNLVFSDGETRDILCTHCVNPADDDFNYEATDPSGEFIAGPDDNKDLDHIFVQDGYCYNFDAVSVDRLFMNRMIWQEDIQDVVPISDHYGVGIQVAFKPGAGGRIGGSAGKCEK